MKKEMLKKIGIAVICMSVLAVTPAQMHVRAAETKQQAELQTVEVKTADDMKKLATTLSATWNESTKTLTLKTDVSLKKEIVINRKADLTINMNGCTLSDGRLTINREITLKIEGKGAFKNCQIKNYYDGKTGTTVLSGNVTYECTDETPVWTNGGILKIMEGTDIRGGIHASGDVRMSGGTVEGEVNLSYNEWNPRGGFAFTGGTINGDLSSYGVDVTISGGMVNGDMKIGEDTDFSATKLLIEGGTVNGQIVLASIRPTFTMTGGTIQSEKSPVIDAGYERMPGTDDKRQGLGNICISGGEIISALKGGIGIRVYNSNVNLTGGLILNTTGSGGCGVSSCTYTRKTSYQAHTAACVVKGFRKPTEHLLKKDHCGREVSYQFNKKTATLTISGEGEIFDGTFFPDSILKRVKHVIISDGVTNVGKRNFYECAKLKDVLIADSVTEIGDGAFGECTSLAVVHFPSDLKKIGREAFFHDLSLKEAVMPDGVESIGAQSFWECVCLKKLVLSESLTQIPDYAFGHCDSLTEVVIPESVTEISHGAFASCGKLQKVTMGEHVKIGKSAFSGTPYIKKK